MDAGDLFAALREPHETAAIPVLFIGNRITGSVRQHPCRMAIDGDMDETATPDAVAAWLAKRLREHAPDDRDSNIDPMTGLPNRAAFCRNFNDACGACHATQEPAALAVLSLDVMGDGSEPPAGLYERILPEWARGLTVALRATDHLAHWSSGAFVALLAGEDTVGATQAIERAFAACRQTLADACGEFANCLSMSEGVTSVTPGMPVAYAAASAERHLFSAKTAGGNRVVASDSRLYRRPDRALVVIDDKLMGRVIKALLDHVELKVVHATCLDQALAACSGRQRFQLIVIDECLAKGEGFKALEQIKALPGNRAVPTIMLLAEHSEFCMARALELGANDYAGRPFAPLPFVSRVYKLLENGAAHPCAAVPCYRILIVDQSLDDLILVGATLHQRGGLTVYLAYGTKDIRERLATQPVDIILAPLAMLKRESPVFVDQFGGPLSPDIAVVGTNDSVGDMHAGPYDRRISGVIRKPFNVLTLGSKIEQITGISTVGKSNGADPDHISHEIQRVLTLFSPSTGLGARSESLPRLDAPEQKRSTVRCANPQDPDSLQGWKWF